MGKERLSRRLRIAVLIRHYNPSGGGAERYCVELTKQLAQQHEVHLFAQTFSEHTTNITVHRIPQWLKRPRYINQLLFSWLTRKPTAEGFDIVHSHDMVTHANVFTLHVPCVRTRWTESEGVTKILRWMNTLLSPRKLTYLWMEKIQVTPHPGKQLIAVSDFLARNIMMNYPKTRGNITIAYPGFNYPPFPEEKDRSWREKHNIPISAFLLLVVANDFKKKGVQSIIDALVHLSHPQIHLVIAGGGEPKSILIPTQLHSYIHLLGPVNNIGHLYPQVDALVHPTLVDTYGMAALEAMAHRLPVIVSNQNYCGFSEHLNDEEALLIQNPMDAIEIANKIEFLFKHPEERNRIAQRGWEKTQTITWEETTVATLHAYQLALISGSTS